jgi:hypothetical protein
VNFVLFVVAFPAHHRAPNYRRNKTHTAPAPPSDRGADANASTEAARINSSRTTPFSTDTPSGEFNPRPWTIETQR